ncbi:hypothetical protein Btru_075063 [Bulinus truncatus]|nr:hypothetical protein Btru_075063 [Bulinus truncatus]
MEIVTHQYPKLVELGGFVIQNGDARPINYPDTGGGCEIQNEIVTHNYPDTSGGCEIQNGDTDPSIIPTLVECCKIQNGEIVTHQLPLTLVEAVRSRMEILTHRLSRH